MVDIIIPKTPDIALPQTREDHMASCIEKYGVDIPISKERSLCVEKVRQAAASLIFLQAGLANEKNLLIEQETIEGGSFEDLHNIAFPTFKAELEKRGLLVQFYSYMSPEKVDAFLPKTRWVVQSNDPQFKIELFEASNQQADESAYLWTTFFKDRSWLSFDGHGRNEQFEKAVTGTLLNHQSAV